MNTWRRAAMRRWPHAEWVHGSGRYASLAWCGVLTVQLYETLEAAQRAKAFIDETACGHACHGPRGHEIVTLQEHPGRRTRR